MVAKITRYQKCRDCGSKAFDHYKSRCSSCSEKHNARNKKWREARKNKNIVEETKDNTSESEKETVPVSSDTIVTIRIQNSLAGQTQNVLSDPKCKVKAKIAKNVNNRLSQGIKNQIRWFESTEQLLGCTVGEYKEFIESKFEKGMTWDNWGQWSIDHIKPISSYDLCDPLQRLKAFNYNNTNPVWAHLNLKKSCTYTSTP